MGELVKTLMEAPPELWTTIILSVVCALSVSGNVWQAKNWMKERQRAQDKQSESMQRLTDSLSTVNVTMAAMLELVRNLANRHTGGSGS